MISTGFRSLDAAIGGLAERKDYLIYGPLGSGKTAFGLNFLHAGLTSGEVVALVTRRSPRMVFDHGRTFGWDLESSASESQLILLEYTPKILQNTAGTSDESQIIAELNRLLDGTGVQRIVFDPFTTMLEGTTTTNVGFRCRALLEQLSTLGSTNMYLMDTPESEPYLNQCKDQFHGMMRMEWTSLVSQTYRLTVERSATLQSQAAQIDFQLRYLNGMAELSTAEVLSGNGNKDVRRKILTIVPPQRQPLFRAVLSNVYTVSEASGAADGMAKMAAEAPDLIVIERAGQDIDGLEVCRKLRGNGLNMPIIVVGDRLRRARDRVEIIAAGADACLQTPLDGRMLKLEIQNLLHRYDAKINRLQGRLPDSQILADLKRNATNKTSDPEYFFQRLEQEIAYSSDNDISFSVLFMRPESSGQNELSGCAWAADSLIREYDLVFTGEQMVAVLLAEADELGAAAFLKGFHNICKTKLPRVTCLSYRQQPEFMLEIRQLLKDGVCEQPCEASRRS